MIEQNYKTIVTPKGHMFNLNLKEIWRYRDLILLFIKRDFISKYKQTILGPAWAVIQPLMTTVVFTIVFGNLAGLTTVDVYSAKEIIIPGFLFYMAGNICWSYFSTTVSSTSNTFIANTYILGKVYFPRAVMPISITLSNLISFFIQFAMLTIFCLAYLVIGRTYIQVTGYAFLVPLCILQMMILSMGIGIIVSSVTTKYRDLAMLVTFGLQLWQYACPIAYGLKLIPERYLELYLLNPVSPIVTTFRYGMFGTGYFNLIYYLISWVVTLIVFFIGLIMFNKIEKTFIDTI